MGSRLQGCIGLGNENFYEVRWGPRCGSSNGAGLGNFGVGVAVGVLKGVGFTLEVRLRPSLLLPLGRGSACLSRATGGSRTTGMVSF